MDSLITQSSLNLETFFLYLSENDNQLRIHMVDEESRITIADELRAIADKLENVEGFQLPSENA